MVRIVGVIDATAAPALQWQLAAAARAAAPRSARVLLDLSGVLFLDQVGLDVLLDNPPAPHTRVHRELFEPTPAIIKLLHETHLNGTASAEPEKHQTGPGRRPLTAPIPNSATTAPTSPRP